MSVQGVEAARPIAPLFTEEERARVVCVEQGDDVGSSQWDSTVGEIVDNFPGKDDLFALRSLLEGDPEALVFGFFGNYTMYRFVGLEAERKTALAHATEVQDGASRSQFHDAAECGLLAEYGCAGCRCDRPRRPRR